MLAAELETTVAPLVDNRLYRKPINVCFRPEGHSMEPTYAAWEAAYEGSFPDPLTPRILRRTQRHLNAMSARGGLRTVMAPCYCSFGSGRWPCRAASVNAASAVVSRSSRTAFRIAWAMRRFLAAGDCVGLRISSFVHAAVIARTSFLLRCPGSLILAHSLFTSRIAMTFASSELSSSTTAARYHDELSARSSTTNLCSTLWRGRRATRCLRETLTTVSSLTSFCAFFT